MNEQSRIEELLKQAKQELNDLEARRSRIDERLRMVAGAVSYFEELLEKSGERSGSQGAVSVTAETAVFKGVTAVNAAQTVLRASGKPLHVKEIVRQILKGGFDGQRNPKRLYANLFTTLTRNPAFAKGSKPATFGLAEWAQPKLGVL